MLADKIKLWGEELVEQGIEQGIKKGKEQGETAALRQILTRQLQQKFGELPPEAVELIGASDRHNLETCLDRILSAKSLQEVISK